MLKSKTVLNQKEGLDMNKNKMRESTKEQYLHTIFDAYYYRLCFYAGRYLKDEEEAKDIVQEVFVTIWEKGLQFESEIALRSFLYSAVHNATVNQLTLKNIHEKHHEKILKQSAAAETNDYVNGRIEEEVLWTIFSAIDNLPPECQKIFKLSYLDGYELQKVADELHISVHTVKSQRARAKKLLQEQLKDLFPVFIVLFL